MCWTAFVIGLFVGGALGGVSMAFVAGAKSDRGIEP
jgi:hypothetical protein